MVGDRDPVAIEWGKALRNRRKALGYTQDDLAEMLGVTKAAVSKWERGGAVPTHGNQARIAGALKVSAHALFPIHPVAPLLLARCAA